MMFVVFGVFAAPQDFSLLCSVLSVRWVVCDYRGIESQERSGALAIFLDSSAVEHPAVNRRVVGSNPTRGVLE